MYKNWLKNQLNNRFENVRLWVLPIVYFQTIQLKKQQSTNGISFGLTFIVASTWVDIVSPMFILKLFNRMGSLLIKKLSYKALFNTSMSSYKYDSYFTYSGLDLTDWFSADFCISNMESSFQIHHRNMAIVAQFFKITGLSLGSIWVTTAPAYLSVVPPPPLFHRLHQRWWLGGL